MESREQNAIGNNIIYSLLLYGLFPVLTDNKCEKCKKKLMDYEVIYGCFVCAQFKKVKDRKRNELQKA